MNPAAGHAGIDSPVEASGSVAASATVVSSRDIDVCWCCGQVHRNPPLAPNTVAHCVRCDAVLARGHRMTLSSLLALTLAAGLLFVIAQFAPMVTVRLTGPQTVATFPNAVWLAWQHGQQIVAVIAGGTAIAAPAALIVMRLYLLLPLVLAGQRAPGFVAVLRLMRWMSRWSMVEVLTVSALVSIVRVAAIAQASIGAGLIAVCVMTLVLAAMQTAGLRLLWDSVGDERRAAPKPVRIPSGDRPTYPSGEGPT